MSVNIGIKKTILKELAKSKVGVTNLELSEKLGFTKQQVNDSLRESVGNNYALKVENLGAEGILYTITDLGFEYLGIKLKKPVLPVESNVQVKKKDDVLLDGLETSTKTDTINTICDKKSALEQKSGHPILSEIKTQKIKSNTAEKADVIESGFALEIAEKIKQDAKPYPFVTDSVVTDDIDDSALRSLATIEAINQHNHDVDIRVSQLASAKKSALMNTKTFELFQIQDRASAEIIAMMAKHETPQRVIENIETKVSVLKDMSEHYERYNPQIAKVLRNVISDLQH